MAGAPFKRQIRTNKQKNKQVKKKTNKKTKTTQNTTTKQGEDKCKTVA